jgi:hypothetical protein
MEGRKPAIEKGGDKSKEKQSSNKFSTPGSGRKVMDWVSLFQNSEETKMMENSGLAHYSCTQLLKDMEAAAESDCDSDKGDMVSGFDDEIVQLPENLLETTMEIDTAHGLNIKLDELSRLDGEGSGMTFAQEKDRFEDKVQKRSSEGWGLSWWRRGIEEGIVMAGMF